MACSTSPKRAFNFPEIRNDGHSLMSIWEALVEEGHIHYGYQAFRRYADELTRNQEVVR
ncbi:TraK family protein [Burkholderia cenocepacia]|uniref:TraK family protein n=1 Tax=Burkholderia cenocepacia TaxID=95486 RepID=UPI0024B17DBE|nr:TraK family protein [Burkholderia cenocepacia]